MRSDSKIFRISYVLTPKYFRNSIENASSDFFSQKDAVGMALAGNFYTENGKIRGCCTKLITSLMDKKRYYGTVADSPGKGRRKVAQRTRRSNIRHHF